MTSSDKTIRRVVRLFVLGVVAFCLSGCRQRPDFLTAGEQSWLENNLPRIRVVQFDSSPPLEFFNKGGVWDGISADFIDLIESKLGVRFQPLPLPASWVFSDSIKLMQKVIVIKCNFQNTEERTPYLNFTSPYIDFPHAIITRRDFKGDLLLERMAGMKISVVQDFAIQHFIQKKYPDLPLDLVSNEIEGLEKVSRHQSDAMICNLATANYLIEKFRLTNLRMAGTAGPSNQLCFATNANAPQINRILDKALAQITLRERRAVFGKWFSLSHGSFLFNRIFLYVLSTIGILVFVSGGFVFLWNRVLKRQVSQRTRQLEGELCERRKMEHRLLQTQKMEALGTFAGGIAHDFNNTLGTIIGYAEMMEMFDTQTGSRSEKRLTHILNAAYRGKGLVRQILTFCRRSEQEKLPVFINPIVRETLDFLRAGIPSTIEIVKTNSCGADAVYADPTHIHQLLMNLAANAVQAMGAKGGRLEVGLSETGAVPAGGYRILEPGSGPYILIRVSDTGCGMTPETLEHVFEPFYTTKKAGAGTGMGLSVVHGIVKDLGGTIRVETRLGAGSVFEVYLPRYSGDIARIEKQAAAGPLLRGAVLFVDDDQDQTDFVRDILSELGCEVKVSTSGFEALAIFRSDPGRYDLVITDQVMPQITGMELASKMLAIRPDVSIVLCSGYSPGLSAEDVSAAGMRTFVKKPLGAYDLIDIVRKYLPRASSDCNPNQRSVMEGNSF